MVPLRFPYVFFWGGFQVFFLPLGNTILSCFSDDSIFAWESESLSCKYQLPVPEEGPRVHYKAFAVTR